MVCLLSTDDACMCEYVATYTVSYSATYVRSVSNMSFVLSIKVAQAIILVNNINAGCLMCILYTAMSQAVTLYRIVCHYIQYCIAD